MLISFYSLNKNKFEYLAQPLEACFQASMLCTQIFPFSSYKRNLLYILKSYWMFLLYKKIWLNLFMNDSSLHKHYFLNLLNKSMAHLEDYLKLFENVSTNFTAINVYTYWQQCINAFGKILANSFEYSVPFLRLFCNISFARYIRAIFFFGLTKYRMYDT